MSQTKAQLLGPLVGDNIDVEGDLNFDSGTFKVDPTNNRVGINNANPTKTLDVGGDTQVADLYYTADYPTIRPTLDLAFAYTKKLDSRITFTRSSTATYVGTDGLIKTAAANEPRFDHNPATGESLGLLVEESRTNRFSNSTTYAGTGWNLQSTDGVTTNTTDIVAPDGSLTATKWQPTTSTVQYIYAGTNGALGTSTYTMSVWVRTPTGESTTFSMNLYAPTQGPGAAAFTATDTWQRFSWTFTAQNQTTAYPVLVEQLNKILYIWGPQIEAGSFPTSYIPTSGSTVTRSADISSMTGTNLTSWYNQLEGTVFSDIHSVKSGGASFGWTLNAGSGLARYGLNSAISGSAGGTYFTDVGGYSLEWGAPGPTTIAGGGRGVFAYKSSDYAAYGNGTEFTSAQSDPSSVNTTINELALGFRGNYSANSYLNGYIRRFIYYPRRLNNSQLQNITL